MYFHANIIYVHKYFIYDSLFRFHFFID